MTNTSAAQYLAGTTPCAFWRTSEIHATAARHGMFAEFDMELYRRSQYGASK